MFIEWENNSGKLQIISRKFQNNAIDDVKQISLNHVINAKKLEFKSHSSRGCLNKKTMLHLKILIWLFCSEISLKIKKVVKNSSSSSSSAFTFYNIFSGSR